MFISTIRSSQIKPWHNQRTLLIKRLFGYSSTRETYKRLEKENDINMAEYFFEHGLRKVKPYHFYFRCYAKVRMYGSSLLDVFQKEYRGRTESYYRYAIEKGLITVNGEKTTPDRVIKHHDLMSHAVHRHEPPVTDQAIQTIYENEDMLVVNKPASIQVHPSGRYRHNSVVHIMRKEMNQKVLLPSNRLDRMTSGILLISKNAQAANTIGLEMRTREISKEYICRVSGRFPDQQIVCNEPIKQLAHIVALNYVHPNGKQCTTVFDRIAYNGQTSLVRCRPMNGRTHQIRVHLRYLGYPIANDPIYGYSTAWSDRFPVGQALQDPSKIIQTMIDTAPYDYMDDDAENKSGLPRCKECNVPLLQSDPIPAQLALWLHARKYNGSSWSYETPLLPDWADDSYKHGDVIIPASY